MIIEPQLLSDTVIVQAIETNVEEAYRSTFSSWSNSHFEKSSQIMWNITDIDDAYFNVVFRTRFSQDDIDQAIERIKEKCLALNVGISWTISPTSRPIDLWRSLSAHGFKHLKSVAGMVIDLNQIKIPQSPVEGLSIQKVQDTDTFHQWMKVVTMGFKMENIENEFAQLLRSNGLREENGWHYFLGLYNGKPIATSAIYLGSQSAGVYYVTTLPEAYRKGIGTAITAAALAFGRKENYHLGILQATTMGFNLYSRLGFQDYCQFHDYGWHG